MKKLLSRHYFPIFVFTGVLAGCIYTGNWSPFFILLAVCFLVAVVMAVIIALSKRNINIYIVEHDEKQYISEDRFREDQDSETLH